MSSLKFELKGNAEYAAQVIEVKHLTSYPELDNLVGVQVNGMTALVGKNVKVGDRLLAIPAGAQVSKPFAEMHNLTREQGGYLEDKLRVRAIRLRGIPSNLLTVEAPAGLEPGMLVDTFNGVAFCWKYEPPVKANTSKAATANAKAWKRVDKKFLPEHIDTSNWYRNVGSVPMDAVFTLTQKLHGTSIRIANTLVKRELNWFERLAVKLGINVADTEYAFLAGSRRVIKDVNNPNQNHFYDEDIYTREGKKFEDMVPRGFVVYGELIGWAGTEKPIQKNYTYALPKGQCALYVYRVATVTPDGIITDLTWPAVKAFCHERGMNHVPEYQTFAEQLTVEDETLYISDSKDLIFTETKSEFPWTDAPVGLSANSPCDEGLVVRVDTERGTMPEFYKAKSQQFLEHESKLLDNDEEVLS